MIDPLEPRFLLTASLQFDGTLFVAGEFKKTGSPKPDRITVIEDFDQGIFVFQNGQTFGPFGFFDVSQIQVDAGGGADKVLSRNSDGTSIVEIPMIISGGAGNDTLEGGDNGDTIAGGGGNDYIGGGLGGDELYGGPGNDRINGSTFAVQEIADFADDGDFIDGGSGRDIADYSTRLESLFLSNDGIADDGALDTDFFTGEPSPKELDNISISTEDIYGGAEQDAIAAPGAENFGAATGSSNSYIDGGGGDDVLFGELGNDTILGGKGDDTLCGGTGADFLDGGVGDDILLGDYRFIRSSGSNPDFAPVFDFFPGPFSGDTLIGGEGNDIIRGGGDTYFATQSGNDSIDGGLGTDLLFGDDGNDIIKGSAGSDLLEGGAGDDSLLGGNDDDIILNNALTIDPQQGLDNDLVDGGDGFDIAQSDQFDTQTNPPSIEFYLDTQTILDIPSGGAPLGLKIGEGVTTLAVSKVVTISGTGKADSVSITQVGDLVSVNVNGAVTTYSASKTRRFVIETGKGNDTIMMQTSKGKNPCTVPLIANGAGGNDTIVGGSADDEIYGGGEDDVLIGGAGRDQLFGGYGNDNVSGGADGDVVNGGDPGIKTADGTDVLSGGPGNDQADYRARSDNLTVTMNDDKANDGATGEKDNVGSDIENFFSGTGNDKITGNASDNILSGSDGADTLFGLAGNDKMIPESGKDEVNGGAGFDVYALADKTRDDVDEPFQDLVFNFVDLFSGDVQVDYSTVSQRFLGRASG